MSHFRFFLGRDDVLLLFVCHSVVSKSVCLIFSHYSNAVRSCCNMSLACWLVIGLKILMRLAVICLATSGSAHAETCSLGFNFIFI